MQFKPRHEKLVLAIVAIIVFGALAALEVIDGNAALLAIVGVLTGMGVSDGVNVRQR